MADLITVKQGAAHCVNVLIQILGASHICAFEQR